MPRLKDGLYAMYLRKSRADLERERFGELETLAIHERVLLSLARRDGYVLDKPYYKELVSGEHIADRAEFQKLMRKVEAGAYKGVLVHEVSRLGRGEPMEYGYVLFTLKRTGTHVITPQRVYDPQNPDDLRALQMEMFLSNMELGNTRWRLANGSRARAEMGCFVKSRPAFGYDRVKVNGFWTLEANDDAPTVRTIFERAAAGDPLGMIAREFNEAGMRTPSGGFWRAARIGAIIENPVYKGKIRYNYNKRELIPTDGFNYVIKNTHNEDFILVDGLHDGIVSEKLWEEANNRNNGCAPVAHDRTLKNPLAGLLVCKKCGAAMVRFTNHVKSSGNQIEHYRHAPFTDCHAQGIRLEAVIDALCETLEKVANDLEAKETIGKADTIADELEAVEKRIAREERTLDKLVELYVAEAITVDEFMSRREKSESLQESLKQRRDKLASRSTSPREIAFTIRDAIEKLKDESVPAQVKNTALRTFIERIEFENFTPPRSRNYDIRLDIYFKE